MHLAPGDHHNRRRLGRETDERAGVMPGDADAQPVPGYCSLACGPLGVACPNEYLCVDGYCYWQ